MFDIKIMSESFINHDLTPVVSVSVSREGFEDFLETRKKASRLTFAIFTQMDDRDDTKYCFLDWVKAPKWDPRAHYRAMHIGTVKWFNESRHQKIRVYLTRGKD